MNENEPNVPKLRFPGFTDPWEQRKLGEMCSFAKGRGYSKADISSTGSPLLLYGRLYTNYQIIIDDVAVASAVCRSGIILGGDLNVIMPQGELDSCFVALEMTYGNAHYDLAKRAQGKSVVHVHNSDIAEVEFVYPTISEQRKISSFILSIDHLITLHQRKLEHLQQMKKGLLQKMFPKDGESVPELRFPGFTDPWEQRKVGDLLKERNQQAPESAEYPLMAFIAHEGVAPKGERYDRSALVNDTKNKLYKKTEYGDFIYSSNNLETGSIGLNKYGKASISPVYSIFYPTEIANSGFLGRRLVRKDFVQSMIKWRQGVIYGQWRIHESDFTRISIAVPKIAEQIKIGEFLDTFDSLITLHQRKLEHLQQMKKGLLQQMFV